MGTPAGSLVVDQSDQSELKSHEMGRSGVPRLAPGVAERLSIYVWPGNVRELENVVARELILHPHGALTFEELHVSTVTDTQSGNEERIPAYPPNEILPLDTVMAGYIQHILDLTNGRIEGLGGAAELLEINPSTLRKRLRKLGVPFGKAAHKQHKEA